jgi:hypothetical protein
MGSPKRAYSRRTMLLGGNPYRAKAYISAAENRALLTEPLETVVGVPECQAEFVSECMGHRASVTGDFERPLPNGRRCRPK